MLTIVLIVVGIAVLSVVGLLVLAGLWATLGDRLSGVSRIEAELRSRGLHPHFANLVVSELRGHSDGVTGAVGLVVVALLALAGARVANARPGLDPSFIAFTVPAVCCLVWAGVIFSRKQVTADASPLFRALFLAPQSISELVPTTVLMDLNVTTVIDALAATRVTQRNTPVPHVLLRFRDGSTRLLRGVADDDSGAVKSLAALHKHWPHAKLGAEIPLSHRQPEPAAATHSGRPWLVLGGIAVLTAGLVGAVLALDDSRLSARHAAGAASLERAATAAKARLRAVSAAPLACSLPATTERWDLAFVAERNAADDWPMIRAAVPFTLDRTGASLANTAVPASYLAAVQLGAVSGTATMDVVVIDVSSGEIACEGRLTGAVDPRAPGGISHGIDQLLVAALLPGRL